MFKETVEQRSNIRNWKESFDIFANVIGSGDDTLKVRAMVKLARLSKFAPEYILRHAVPMLLELLQSPPSNVSPLVQEASAHCLKCIASQGKGSLIKLIGEPHAIAALLTLLSNSEEGGLQRSLLKCIRYVVMFWDPGRSIFSNSHLEVVLLLLDNWSGESKLILLEILSALALAREVRKLLWLTRRVHLLVEVARCGSMDSRTRAAQAIGLLGLIKRARLTLVESGAVPVLIHLLEEGDPATKLVAGNALGVIACHIDHIRPIAQAGVIPLYAELLQGPDVIGKEIAEDVFCVLAVYEENAIPIVEHLVRILRGDDVFAKAAAADVIWDLSSYKYSFPVMQNSGTIPILVDLLEDEDVDVREKVAGAVAQLSQDESDRAVLANCEAIPRLINMLENDMEEVRDNAAEALVNFSLDPLLGDEISRILGNPTFLSMRERVMRIRASDERLDISLRQISARQLAWHP